MTNGSSSYTKHDDLSLAEWQFLPGYFGGIPRVRPLTEKKGNSIHKNTGQRVGRLPHLHVSVRWDVERL